MTMLLRRLVNKRQFYYITASILILLIISVPLLQNENCWLSPTCSKSDAVIIADKDYKGDLIAPAWRNLNRTSHTDIVHQSWKVKELPQRFQKWSNSWKTCFPDFKYYLWTDKDNYDFVKRYYPQYLVTYDSFHSNILRVDTVRYLYMHQYGGIYADLDAECLRPFHNFLNSSESGCQIMFSKMDHDDNKWVQNSFMYAAQPGHPFWIKLIDEIVKRAKLRSGDMVEAITGPVMLMDMLKMENEKESKICIKSGELFNPFSWVWGKNNYKLGAKKSEIPHCKDLNRMTEKDLELCKLNFPNSYVIQYHTQVWKAGKL